jgi:hypothetical protein
MIIMENSMIVANVSRELKDDKNLYHTVPINLELDQVLYTPYNTVDKNFRI